MKNDSHSFDDSRSSAQIESDIRRTRGRMDETLDALSSRLNARYFLNVLLDRLEGSPTSTHGGDPAKAVYRAVARKVKEHPLPSALIGAGLAMWLRDVSRDQYSGEEEADLGYSARGTYARSPDDLYADDEFGFAASTGESSVGRMDRAKARMSDVKRRASDKLGSATSAASERSSHLADRAKHKLHGLGDSVRHHREDLGERAHHLYDRGLSAADRMRHRLGDRYRASGERFDRGVEDHPMALGVGFAALGLLAGLILPRSRKEDEWVGERSDHLADLAKDKGHEMMEHGKAVAHRVADAVKEEAGDQGFSTEGAKEGLSALTEKAASVASRAKEEARQAAEEEGLVPKAMKPDQDKESGSAPKREGESGSAPMGSSEPGI